VTTLPDLTVTIYVFHPISCLVRSTYISLSYLSKKAVYLYPAEHFFNPTDSPVIHPLVTPSAHTARAASAGAASAGAASAGPVSASSSPSAHTTGAASAGAASAGAASAEPVSAAGGQAASAAADVKLPSGLSAAALSAARPAGQQNPAQMKAACSRLLGEFPAVVCASKRLLPVSHDVVHHIITHGPPIASKFRKLDGEKLAAAKAEFKQLEEDDIIQRSTTPWSSPLHMVRKADGSWRPCGDFRRLNLVTEPDVYPLPNMLDFAAKAAGCTVFSKIDLRKGTTRSQ
jgi:hypothetical protein